VRLLLEARGFQTRRYGNLLASIHVVVGRLVTKNEIMQAGTKGGADKPAYRWAYKMDPLPKSGLSWEPLYGSGMRGDEKPKPLGHPYRPGIIADVRKKE
jgi:hypothetical protein